MATDSYACRAFGLLMGLALAVLVGCAPTGGITPDKISLDPHASGNNQAAAQGQILPKPLRVVVEGPLRPGLLGGKGSRPHVRGAAVTFTVVNPDTGATFPDSGQPSITVTTDAGGVAIAQFQLGKSCGDVDVTAAVDTPKGPKTARFRLLSGVEVIGKDLEAPTNARLDEIGVRLFEPSGAPAVGVPVFFRTEGAGDGASVGSICVDTDGEGRAVTSWTLGATVQPHFLFAEIRDDRTGIPEDQRFHMLAVEFEAMAISKRDLLLSVMGGLAVFILGMKWMSNGLLRMADRRLKRILRAMTRNRFVATGVGAGITAVIQSSSATTVMTVGFVNAGLLTLTQAIGVIYGANIGTTMTAQIIVFKLDVLIYPSIALGLILSSLGRRAWQKALGETILGFGLLFLGMTTMSDVLKPLKFSPGFQAWFQMFDCTPAAGGFVKVGPAFMCLLIGTVTTCVIQSSSATIGLVLALASQGLLTFYTAVPLVLGDNIGTTITAILASLGANRNAKRAAVAHTLFNVFGATYMFILLFIPLWHGQPLFMGFISAITPGDVFAATPENLPRHIANAHTAFNVINCLLFLPLVNIMARVCKMIIPVTDADRETVLVYLEPRLLASPALALEQAVKEVVYMLHRAQESINEACEFFLTGRAELSQTVLKREELIDRLQHEITAYLVDLSRQRLEPAEATLIPALIHAVNDAERVGDHSESLVKLTQIKREHDHDLSGPAEDEIRAVQKVLNEQFEAIYQTVSASDPKAVELAKAKEQEINSLLNEATDAHVHRLERGECEVQAGVIFLDFLGHLERVGDHLVNIAERAGTIVQVLLD